MPFIDSATIKQIDETRNGRTCFKLTKPLVYRVGLNSSDGIRITIPADFKTDLASTPRIVWSIFPPVGLWTQATILHDYLYGLAGCSRFLADALFRDAMRELGVPVWRRVIMYYAVRLFGKWNYRKEIM